MSLRSGDVMSDGAPMPGAHDGTGYFRRRHTVSIVRNHEMNPLVGDVYQGIDGTVGPGGYDRSVNGGVTISPVRPAPRAGDVGNFVALRGTVENCSGGRRRGARGSPARRRRPASAPGWNKPHGYVFEVPAWVRRRGDGRADSGDGAVRPRGRRRRPAHRDRLHDRGQRRPVRRAVPLRAGPIADRLAAGGRLQMLAVEGRPNFFAGRRRRSAPATAATGSTSPIPTRPTPRTTRPRSSTRVTRIGAMRFLGNEGACFADGSLVFTESDGGPDELGQVWRYTPGPSRGPRRLRPASAGGVPAACSSWCSARPARTSRRSTRTRSSSRRVVRCCSPRTATARTSTASAPSTSSSITGPDTVRAVLRQPGPARHPPAQPHRGSGGPATGRRARLQRVQRDRVSSTTGCSATSSTRARRSPSPGPGATEGSDHHRSMGS